MSSNNMDPRLTNFFYLLKTYESEFLDRFVSSWHVRSYQRSTNYGLYVAPKGFTNARGAEQSHTALREVTSQDGC